MTPPYLIVRVDEVLVLKHDSLGRHAPVTIAAVGVGGLSADEL
jgi:hypothetical protein